MPSSRRASRPIGAGKTLPLSNAQALLWTAHHMYRDAPIYNMAFKYIVDGTLDRSRFTKAFDYLVGEAESLRTTFHGVAEEPIQTIHEVIDYQVSEVDFRDSVNPAAAFKGWAYDRCRTPINLAKRTFDIAVADLGDEQWGWYLCQHHLVADASSFEILYIRLSELYADLNTGEKLPQLGARPDGATRGVLTESDDVDEDMVLYGVARPRWSETESKRHTLQLQPDVVATLDALVARSSLQSITPDLGRFKALLAVTAAYLYRVGGSDIFRIGVPLLNRPTRADKRTPGLFTEVFPFNMVIEDGETFESLFEKVSHRTQEFLSRARPGTATSDQNRHLTVALNYLGNQFGEFAGMPTDVEWIHSGHLEPDHTLWVHFTQWGSSRDTSLLFDFNSSAVDEATQKRSIEHFTQAMNAMIADPGVEIASVALVGTEEAAAISDLAHGPRTPPPQSITSYLNDVIHSFGTTTAMTEKGRKWSYDDLDLASRSIAASVPPGGRVGVVMERSAAAVITMLGVLRAGAAFVPVDPDWPTQRIEFVLKDAGVTLVVVDRNLEFDLAAVPIEHYRDLAQADPVAASDLIRAGSTDLAYVLYTSGSTGSPKGALISNGALANYVAWARNTYDQGNRLRFPLFTPLTFDLTMTSIFVPLTSGGSIHVYPNGKQKVDTAVRDVVADNAVDIVKLTPSHLSLIEDMSLENSRIVTLILGGEDLLRATASRALEKFGGPVRLFNEYGPTEATVGCIVEEFEPDKPAGGASVPIGRPIDNMSAWILDDAMNPVPFGVVGEIWLAGSGVADGYVGNPDLTDDKFRRLDHIGEGLFYRTGDRGRMLPDGTIEFLGRSDDQVKIRGARVELAEVEARLAAHSAVRTVVASAQRRRSVASSDVEYHCAVCGISSHHPRVSLDKAMVCSECRAFESYREEASVYFKTLEELSQVLDRAREQSKSDYDCISLLSGGTDSTFALARIVDLGARPLAFTLDNGYISGEAKQNIRRVTEALGVDHIFGSTPAMNEIFVDSLQRHANVCNGCFKTIYTLSMNLAREKGIPLIVTGLSRGRFFETRLTRELFSAGPITSDEIEDKVKHARRAYHRVDDGPRRLLDVEIFETDSIFDDVHFADFYRYVDASLDDMLAYLQERFPWMRPADTDRSAICLINDVGTFVHKRERGFHNYALPYSWDVRLGRKQREVALEELDEDIDAAYVQRVLTEIGYPSDISTITDSNRLVVYYVAKDEVRPSELRAFASEVLPAVMVPSQFVEVPEIPLTPNGKVDREALPDADTTRPELNEALIPPFTEEQRTIATIWSAVLGVDQVGIRDDFFDLGGDSIMAIRIVARCNALGITLKLRDLFENPTVEGLANLEKNNESAPPLSPSATDRPSESDMDRLSKLLSSKDAVS